MDSPTRRQLMVGFLEPAGKNDVAAETPSDWMSALAIRALTNRVCVPFMVEPLVTPSAHRKELNPFSPQWTHS